MDGKGCWRDDVVVERAWRSIEDEDAYLKGCESVSRARRDDFHRKLTQQSMKQSANLTH
jgi:hypothetical protein